MPEKRYSIRYNRIKKAFREGFAVNEESSSIVTEPALHHFICFEPVDAVEEDALWGRFSMRIRIEGEAVCILHTAASNEYLMPEERTRAACRSMLRTLGAGKTVGHDDILLYHLKGRYLYLAIEIAGSGSVVLDRLRIDRQGDNFMQTFPEIYQERNSFFHRFMSVFSSMYNDMEDEIDMLPSLLNLDSCDPALLPVYGRWLGIDVGDGFLQEDELRTLVKEAYLLNRMKGTKWALERITEILLGEKGIIVERNSGQKDIPEEYLESFNAMYGKSLYDVTVMIRGELTQTRKSQLMYLLNQYLPIRCRLNLVELGRTGTLDSYTYLDINSSTYLPGSGYMDGEDTMDSAITLL